MIGALGGLVSLASVALQVKNAIDEVDTEECIRTQRRAEYLERMEAERESRERIRELDREHAAVQRRLAAARRRRAVEEVEYELRAAELRRIRRLPVDKQLPALERLLERM